MLSIIHLNIRLPFFLHLHWFNYIIFIAGHVFQNPETINIVLEPGIW